MKPIKFYFNCFPRELHYGQPAVYGWFRHNECLYIGSSSKLAQRFYHHSTIGVAEEVLPCDIIALWLCDTIPQMLSLEINHIGWYHPTYNRKDILTPPLLVPRKPSLIIQTFRLCAYCQCPFHPENAGWLLTYCNWPCKTLHAFEQSNNRIFDRFLIS